MGSKALAAARSTFYGPAGEWLPALCLASISFAEASSELSAPTIQRAAAVLIGLGLLAVGIRRRSPVTAMILVSADQLFSAASVGGGAWATLSATAALFLVSFALGTKADGRRLLVGIGVALAVTSVADSRWPGAHPLSEALFFVGGFLVGLPALAGWLLEDRSRLLRDLRTSSAALRAEQEIQAAIAVSEERDRLTHQLNAVVKSAMRRVQAQVAVASASQGTAGVGAVTDLEAVAREAVAEVRALLEALTAGGGAARPRTLEESLTDAAADGVEVVRPTGGELRVSPAVELAAAGVTDHFTRGDHGAMRIEASANIGGVDLMLDRCDADPVPRQAMLAIGARVEMVGGTVRELMFGMRRRLLVSLPANGSTIQVQQSPAEGGSRSGISSPTVPWLALLTAGEFCLLLAQTQSSPLMHGPRLVNAVAVAAVAAPIASSRRRPLTSAAVSLSVFTLMSLTLTPPGAMAGGAVVWLLFPFLIAASSTFRRALLGLAVCAAFLLLCGWLGLPGTPTVGGAAGIFVTFSLGAWLAGLQVGRRSRLALELHAINQRLTQTRGVTAREAARSERSRIAAELHDIVGHNLTVIVLHAGVARRAWEADHDIALQSLMTIASIASESLSELQLSIDLVDSSAGSGPGLSAADVSDLVETVRRLGVPVDFAVTGPPVAMSRAAQVAAYRVVQEAVTNAIKHASGSPITIDLRFADDALEIEVSNATVPFRSTPPLGLVGRHGLAGMQRRVESIGGNVAWRTSENRFSIRAWIPAADLAS